MGAGDGVARAAQLAFFDIGESDNGLKVPLLSTVFATGYKDAGARVHSASWGNPKQNSYSSFDHQADSFMYVKICCCILGKTVSKLTCSEQVQQP